MATFASPLSPSKRPVMRFWPVAFIVHLVISTGFVWFCSLKLSALVYWIAVQVGSPFAMPRGLFQSKYLWLFQLVVGVASGWSSSRFFRERAALWVWVPPSVFLLFKIFAWRSSTGSVLQPTSWSSVWSHFFGSGCAFVSSLQELSNFGGPVCFDQLFITGPFYCAIAYAVGAVVQRRGVLPELVAQLKVARSRTEHTEPQESDPGVHP